MKKQTVVFVHGWSVTHTDTYGELPRRLKSHAEQAGIDIRIEEIFLGKYISFRDEVQLKDISRAFNTAVEEELGSIIKKGEKFVCITHSTGGPVLRDWLHRYYFEVCPLKMIESKKNHECPLSHLIMLAPANYGSALAQLGKGRLGRIGAWFEGVEPGEGVLNWLELGSEESFAMNRNWILYGDEFIKRHRVYPFVLTGQSIDRKLYDNLNSYTGELGSDGVIRVSAANMNGNYIRLIQENPKKSNNGKLDSCDLVIDGKIQTSPISPLRIISKKSHSGKEMGIMRSVKLSDKGESKELLDSIISCIKVQNPDAYRELYKKFEKETNDVQNAERLETENILFFNRHFIHDKYSMVIFRITDTEGYPVTDFDLLLTSGKDSDPNALPVGFFGDRQMNKINRNTITYYLNHDIMTGTDAVKDKKGKIIREKVQGAETLGFEIKARPDEGFVRYLPCKIKATADILKKVLCANATTIIDVVIQRVVCTNVFKLEKMTSETKPESFKRTKPGEEAVE